jgi:hypothetical protein
MPPKLTTLHLWLLITLPPWLPTTLPLWLLTVVPILLPLWLLTVVPMLLPLWLLTVAPMLLHQLMLVWTLDTLVWDTLVMLDMDTLICKFPLLATSCFFFNDVRLRDHTNTKQEK